MYKKLLSNIENYVKGLFESNHNPALLYHNLAHTETVVSRCAEIAAAHSLSTEDQFILFSAAWFHDTGHLIEVGCGHEVKSVHIMRDFLQQHDIKDDVISKIEGCIMATSMPQNPATLLEQILCDADVYNLGTDEFKKTDQLVKAEIEQNLKTNFCNWDSITLKFLKSHHFFTDYCNRKLKAGKEDNVHFVEKRITSTP
jgi:HD superfamily phosphodiesterase